MYKIILPIVLIIATVTPGCSYFSKDREDSSKNWTVERLYSEAKGAMESGNYSSAKKYFEYLETRYPFGVYGQQSLLDLAYVYYKTQDFDSAVSSCDRFIRLYPQNPHVDYAYYLKGLVNFSRGHGFMERIMPIDLSQRDSTYLRTSFQDFKDLVERFPTSRYTSDTRQRMVYLRNTLGRYEVNVATYYLRRGAYVAAANRARYAVENYPRTPAIPDALVIMAKAYKILEMDDLSRDALRVLKLNYPNHPGIEEVEKTHVN